jgi:hypothetical protein
MSAPTTWPDRTLYCAVVQAPARCFDDGDLQAATFARDRRGSVLAWSGGRAIVFRADRPAGGSAAVRFLLAADAEAGHRYEMLSRHLDMNPIEHFVRTRWIEEGLHVGSHAYPMLVMEWVDGLPLDRHISEHLADVGAPARLRALADEWRRDCRSLATAQVGHGDVHAGNILVREYAERAELRMVDYDNVWVPGLYVPCKEAGHPAFQHPAAGARFGQHMDAFANTLTYLSLAGLAADTGLWAHHGDADDCLLFQSADLESTQRPVWSALLASPDAHVRSLAAVTQRWLGGAPAQYDTLEQALAAADSATRPGVTAPNVWPRRPATPPEPGQWPPAHPEVERQSWTGRAARPPAPRPAPPSAQNRPNRTALYVLLAIAAIVVLAVLLSL